MGLGESLGRPIEDYFEILAESSAPPAERPQASSATGPWCAIGRCERTAARTAYAALETTSASAKGDRCFLLLPIPAIQRLSQLIDDCPEATRPPSDTLDDHRATGETAGHASNPLGDRPIVVTCSRIEFIAALCEVPDSTFGIFTVEIDRHKEILARHGAVAAGDIAAISVSRLIDCVDTPGFLARLGPESVVLAINMDTDRFHLQAMAERLRNATRDSVTLGQKRLAVTCSVAFGVPDSPEWTEHFINRCQLSLVAQRGFGGNLTVAVAAPPLRVPEASPRAGVTPAGRTTRTRHQTLIDDLDDAVETGQLDVAYQPVFSIPNGDLLFCEALLRWHHPSLGTISPKEFVPIAEQQGRSEILGAWVLERAAADVARWRKVKPTARVAVNLSADHLLSERTLDAVDLALERNHLRPDGLIFEVSAKVLTGTRPQEAPYERSITALAERGLSVLLDDFGGTHTSLETLRTLSFDMLKLDGSFVSPLVSNSGDAELVESVLRLADALGILTIAARVETLTQYDRLRDIGVPFAQGYYLATPQRGCEVETQLPGWKVLDPQVINLK